MKNSYRRNNISSERSSLFATLVVVLFIAGTVFGVDAFSGGLLRGYVREGGSTFWAVANTATVFLSESGVFSSKRALEEENAALESAIAVRDEYLAQFQALQEENEALRKMAALAARDPGITAPVLSSLQSSPYGTFNIGAGAAEGVVEGDVALTPGGFVLGVVRTVATHTALVEALFAPGKEVELVVGDIAFVAEGRGGRNARAQVARDAAIEAQTIVRAPLLASRPAGIIGAVESASSSAFTTLYIHVPVNVSALRYVYVVTR